MHFSLENDLHFLYQTAGEKCQLDALRAYVFVVFHVLLLITNTTALRSCSQWFVQAWQYLVKFSCLLLQQNGRKRRKAHWIVIQTEREKKKKGNKTFIVISTAELLHSINPAAHFALAVSASLLTIVRIVQILMPKHSCKLELYCLSLTLLCQSHLPLKYAS